MPVAAGTLIRLLRAAELAGPGSVRGLGVAEFALLKRHVYAALLVDFEVRRPIDVIDHSPEQGIGQGTHRRDAPAPNVPWFRGQQRPAARGRGRG
jgi:hypothetical protein